ncbi:MAG: class I SAM-dependent methyltransferase [Anaerolineae bacterium]|nr:class I SAM-dependent methyltransferase [Anaerolineae bacterium]
MRRYQLVELEDLPWFPRSIRDAGTDYLQFAWQAVRPWQAIASKLVPALAATGDRRLVDLGAGGGGPWRGLLPVLQQAYPDLQVTLTDRYPNLAAWQTIQQDFPPAVHTWPDSVAAAAVPPTLAGFRTVFAALHHFPPSEARAILADAVRQRQGIAAFEAGQRRPLALLAILFAPTLAYLLTPFMRPFRWSRLFWTYVIPAGPFIVLWDGLVSTLRMYTPAELRDLTVGLADDYVWDSGEVPIPYSPIPMTYLMGYPASIRQEDA